MNKFPYTDFHEMNMDWISAKVLALKESIKNINVSIQSVIEQLTGKADKDELATVAFTGDYDDLNTKPVIPDVSNYYDKTEVDDLLDDKADKSDTYTKTEVDGLLDDKADIADLSTVAFSGDYDDLNNKPTIPDVSNYYTKTETDTLLGGKENSLGSGNVGEVLTQVGANLKSWVEPHYMPAGGTSGQVLTKASNADYAAIWDDISADDVSYDHTSSGLTSTNVQGAIDEVKVKIQRGTFTKTGISASWVYEEVTFAEPYTDIPLVSVSNYNVSHTNNWGAPEIDRLTRYGFRMGWWNRTGTEDFMWQAIGI